MTAAQGPRLHGPGPSGVCVRRATIGDLTEVVRLRRALRDEERPWREPATGEETGADLVALTRLQLVDAGQVFLLATAGEHAVGLLRCALVRRDGVARHALLTTAYVVPSIRRQGVLRALVDSAATWGEQQGTSDLRLRTLAGNDVAARAWAALGFAPSQIVHRRVRS